MSETPVLPAEPADQHYGAGRLALGLLGRTWLSFLTGVLVVSLLPLLFGWRPYVVQSDSMAPAIRSGDVVLSSPTDDPDLLLGRVVVFEAPDRADTVITHRVIEIRDDGALVTKGDANQSADSAPVRPEQVRGLGRLLVRWAGLPLVWLGAGAWLQLLLLLATIAIAVVGVIRDDEPDELDAPDALDAVTGPDPQQADVADAPDRPRRLPRPVPAGAGSIATIPRGVLPRRPAEEPVGSPVEVAEAAVAVDAPVVASADAAVAADTPVVASADAAVAADTPVVAPADAAVAVDTPVVASVAGPSDSRSLPRGGRRDGGGRAADVAGAPSLPRASGTAPRAVARRTGAPRRPNDGPNDGPNGDSDDGPTAALDGGSSDRDPADRRDDRPNGPQAGGPPSGTAPGVAPPRPSRRRNRRSSSLRGMVSVFLGGLVALGAPTVVAAAFTATTSNVVNTWAVPNVDYAAEILARAPYLYWRLDETGGTTAADSSGNGRTGRYQPNGNAGSFTRLADGALLTDTPDRAVQLVNASSCITTTSNTAIAGPQVYTVIAWFRAPASYTNGGKLLGFERPQTGADAPPAGNYDRQLYVDGSGRVWFTVYNGGHVALSSNPGLNDDAWHLVVGTQSAAGMRLYVDGALVGSNANTTAEATTGWWRAGCGNLAGWGGQWTGPNNPGTSSGSPQNRPFLGALDEITVYDGVALSGVDVATLWFAR